MHKYKLKYMYCQFSCLNMDDRGSRAWLFYLWYHSICLWLWRTSSTLVQNARWTSTKFTRTSTKNGVQVLLASIISKRVSTPAFKDFHNAVAVFQVACYRVAMSKIWYIFQCDVIKNQGSEARIRKWRPNPALWLARNTINRGTWKTATTRTNTVTWMDFE